MDETGREGILRHGAPALIGAARDSGIWKDIDLDQHDADICRHHRGGCWHTNDVWMFDDYIRGSGGVSHDEAIGSIGGGNHFTEIQVVEETFDGATAYRWGVRRGMIAVMIHTGSVGLGAMVGKHFMDVAKSIYPVDLTKPERGFYVLPTAGPQESRGLEYLSAMGLAANFAVVNRLMLGFMVLRCLSRVAGRQVHGRLVYDAPHNLVWSDREHRHVHRKGACPAECDMADDAFPDGHPVIIPGSMGDSSYLLKGSGSVTSLCSAPHGAGRLAKRGEGRKGKSEELDPIRIVTKIDPVKTRPDITAELRKTMMEEAPSQYKPVTPVIDTVHGAGIAQRVARMRPLLTIKG
jgi:tRNA-splicing ligase RtcB